MADTQLPKIKVVKLTEQYVTFKKEDFENLKSAYYSLYNEHRNDPNVGQKVKYEWLGHYLMLAEICGKWHFPSIENRPEHKRYGPQNE